jgi:hypothetical protein
MSSSAQDRPAAAVTNGMDKIESVMQTALGGIRRSLSRLHEAAQEIATVSVRRTEPTELAEPLIRALQAQRTLEASANVIVRADAAFHSLLDALSRPARNERA